MEEGRQYRVFYNDGERIRDKILVFKKEINNFIVFFNPSSNLEESINIANIISISIAK